MCCIELIENNISEIRTESIALHSSFESKVNSFLDAIISLQQSIDKLSNSLNTLTEKIINEFTYITEEQYLSFSKKLNDLILDLKKSYRELRISQFYSGCKMSLLKFKSEIDSLQEVAQDLNTFKVELSHN